ncbi:MAG: hypothetical protein CVV28_06270 [Methanobacteriales archaeon HGW-Methanobacteriales-1]|jgi:hypothetical protein|nr:MAG: hypothetical protein CVV28_06270 [Methanobacteriales archaeon HGW-Methanobacteriales-1]
MGDLVLNFIQKNRNSILVFIPAIITFCLVLIPTIKYSVPLGGETFYHAALIQFYSENGISWTNTLLWSGQPIYSPLFDFFILSLSKILSMSSMVILKYLQPLFAFLIVLSFSFTAYKMYNMITGFLAGIFVMFSALFSKIMFTTPEAMILIIIPLLAYFYVLALENKSLKYALISGMLLGFAFLTQTISAIVIFFMLTIFTLIIFIMKKEANLKAYWILMAVSMLIAAIWWLPIFIKVPFTFQIFISPYLSQLVAINKYPEFLGIIPLIFAFIGAFYLSNRNQIKDILILTWLLAVIILSFIQFLITPLGAAYILALAIFPLMVMAGIGVQCIRIEGDKRPIYAFTVLILLLGAYYGFEAVNSVQTEIDSQIAIAQWFKSHGDKNLIALSNNSSIDAAIFSMTNQSVFYGSQYLKISKNLNIKKYLLGKYNTLDIINDNVGYIVLNKNVTSMPYAIVAYENKDFKVFELKTSIP